jgi:hypothetical protein
VRERGRKEEKQLPLSLSSLILAPMVGGMASSSCRCARSTRGNGGSGGSEGKLMQGKEGEAAAGGRQARRGGACSGCSQSDGWREGMSVLENLHT